MFIKEDQILNRVKSDIQADFPSIRTLPPEFPEFIPPSIKNDIDFKVKLALLIEMKTIAHPTFVERLTQLRDKTIMDINYMYDCLLREHTNQLDTVASPEALSKMSSDFRAFVTSRVNALKTYEEKDGTIEKVTSDSPRRPRSKAQPASINPFLNLLPPELRKQVEDVIKNRTL